MSQMSVAPSIAKRTSPRAQQTPLRVVATQRRAGSPWFPALCFGLLLAGLVAVLGLNTAMAQDSFEITGLEARAASLTDNQDSLTHAVNSRSSPQRLASRAGELGLVPAETAAFIDVDRGTVLGVATTAEKPDGFNVDAASTAKPEETTSSDSGTSGPEPTTQSPAASGD